MESNKSLFWNKAMFWGFIMALASMLSASLYYATDNFFASTKAWVEIAIYIAAIVLGSLSYKSAIEPEDEFPYAKALGLGVAIAFFASLILALFNFVLFKYIDPSLIDQMLLQAEEALIQAGLSDDMIEQQVSMQQNFMKPSILSVSTIFTTVIYGLIIALLTSIFTRKKSEGGFNAAMNEIKDDE